jgi:hypothetical protein
MKKDWRPEARDEGTPFPGCRQEVLELRTIWVIEFTRIEK